jgi:alkylated DNA repair dioxygenase AlkB
MISKPTKMEALTNYDLDDTDCGLVVNQNFLTKTEADTLLKWAQTDVPFEKLNIKLFGQTHHPKRRTISYGDAGIKYSYSTTTTVAKEWPKELLDMRKRVSVFHPQGLLPNFVHLNEYKNGAASIGYHSDNEKGIVNGAPIISISVGDKRDFIVRKIEDIKPVVTDDKKRRKKPCITIPLQHGSVCIMSGKFQSKYQHSVPVRKRCVKPRINFTFRYMEENK